MKKSFLLSGIIVLTTVANVHAMEGNAPYEIISRLVEDQNWPAIFAFIDSTGGIVDVDEYLYPRDNSGLTLLTMAVIRRNFLAAQTLLEKYKANPNVSNKISDNAHPGLTAYPLMRACFNNDNTMVKLLLMYGANPYLKDKRGRDSFYIARNNPTITALLQAYKG